MEYLKSIAGFVETKQMMLGIKDLVASLLEKGNTGKVKLPKVKDRRERQ